MRSLGTKLTLLWLENATWLLNSAAAAPSLQLLKGLQNLHISSVLATRSSPLPGRAPEGQLRWKRERRYDWSASTCTSMTSRRPWRPCGGKGGRVTGRGEGGKGLGLKDFPGTYYVIIVQLPAWFARGVHLPWDATGQRCFCCKYWWSSCEIYLATSSPTHAWAQKLSYVHPMQICILHFWL